MFVDIVVMRDGEQYAELKRVDSEFFKRNVEYIIAQYCKTPEDFIAVRASKRQIGE